MENLAPIIGLFLGSFAVAFSGALAPGPLLTYTIAESTQRGASTGPLLICGHAVLEVTMVVLLVMGVGPWLSHGRVSGIIGLAGSAVLLWMTVGMFRSIPGLSLATLRNAAVSRTPSPDRAVPVLYGVLMSVANPYWTIWWVTIGLGYITSSIKYGAAGLAAFFTGHILADFVWYSAVSFGCARGGRFIGDGVYRAIIVVCAAGLGLFAVWFGWQGLRVLSAGAG